MNYSNLIAEMAIAPTDETYRQEAIALVQALADRAERLAMTYHHPAVKDHTEAYNKLSIKERREVKAYLRIY